MAQLNSVARTHTKHPLSPHWGWGALPVPLQCCLCRFALDAWCLVVKRLAACMLPWWRDSGVLAADMAQLNPVARTHTKHFPSRHIGKWGASRVPLQRCPRCRSRASRPGVDSIWRALAGLLPGSFLTWVTGRAQSAPGVQCNTVALEGSPQDLARCACLLTWWAAGGAGARGGGVAKT